MENRMTLIRRSLFVLLAAAVLPACSTLATNKADVTRYPIPGSDFPISQAVEVPVGKATIFHSGLTPAPFNPEARKFSFEYWGTTEQQAFSVLSKIKTSLEAIGLTMGDVVKMNVFLVTDPTKAGRMDFDGFMVAYRKFFGTSEQPKLPARTTVQIPGLAAPGMLVEIEVVAVRP